MRKKYNFFSFLVIRCGEEGRGGGKWVMENGKSVADKGHDCGAWEMEVSGCEILQKFGSAALVKTGKLSSA
ncbi:MAG: hypothetical protein J6Y76_01435 [Paludibacteraceae bacterium]|nr:hypothetical protein [Paludibacteraceae bacterium]MBP5290062.1 hypothetical protein [Paludibacteraceae bacterium]